MIDTKKWESADAVTKMETIEKELKLYKKALELMAKSLFGDDCDFRYPECDDLFIYQIPCQKCIDCIVNDYLEKAREE